MRISATGRTEGFTLVELLIVLTIVGLMSAAVVLAMPDPRGNLSAEAEQFAARAAAARNLANVDAEALSMRVTPIGYGFERRANTEWRQLDRKTLADHIGPDGKRAALESGDITSTPYDQTRTLDTARHELRWEHACSHHKQDGV